MDTALRNRLTGAVILVLLAVLLLPELLTGSGRASPAAAAVADAAGDASPERTVEIDLTDAALAPAGLAPQPSAPAPAAGTASETGPVELPVPATREAPAAVPPTAVASPPVAAPETPARAPAAATPTPTPPSTPPPRPGSDSGRFFVQVGTFATTERAEVLRKDLAGRGFTVSINETARGDQRFYRVRVGPVADRKAAEALEAKLRPLAPDRAIVALP